MIVNLNPLLKEARDHHYAVGAFNVYNYETIHSVIEAIKESNTSAIISFGEKYLSNMELKEVVNLIRTMTTELDQKVGIHLDHCKSFDVIKKAIDAGFTSVMIDGSHLPFEENVAITKEVVDYAHQFNVTVEAELGSLSLGSHSNEDDAEEIYTDPMKAREFVLQTNVDCLAVSIGTVHGLYKGEPQVSVERLIEIKDQIDIPFVLHGGSGTPLKTIQECIINGIAKINVNTEISSSIVKAISETVSKKPDTHFSVLSNQAKEAGKKTIVKYMEMFNSVKQ
ncbi:class II fructose-bisphosphate aldolase [Mycoplasmatota bacterium]|nr:class II fructose-bisphosphate aldolase [Mycoplasmatota bacterium]